MSKPFPLTAFDMLFFFPAQLDIGNSCDILVLNGKVDRDRFKKAVQLLSSRHPLLNQRLQRKLWKYSWVPIDENIEFDIRYYNAETQDEQETISTLAKRVWDEPIDLYSERVVRFYITESETKSYVQIISHHVCADGTACTLLASDLAECYGAVTENRPPMPQHTTEQLADADREVTSQLSFTERCWFFISALVTILIEVIFNRYEPSIPTENPGDKKVINVKKMNLGEEGLTDLKQAAKRKSTTLHPLLLTALARAKDDYLSKRNITKNKITIVDLFSMRDMTENNMSRVYNSLVTFFLRHIDSSQSDEEIIASLNSQLRPETKDKLYIRYYFVQIITWLKFFPQRFQDPACDVLCTQLMPSNISVTNPGLVKYPIDTFGELDIVDYYTFPYLYGTIRIMFLANTFHNKLNITCIYDTSAFSADDIEEFMAKYASKLKGMTEGNIAPSTSLDEQTTQDLKNKITQLPNNHSQTSSNVKGA